MPRREVEVAPQPLPDLRRPEIVGAVARVAARRARRLRLVDQRGGRQLVRRARHLIVRAQLLPVRREREEAAHEAAPVDVAHARIAVPRARAEARAGLEQVVVRIREQERVRRRELVCGEHDGHEVRLVALHREAEDLAHARAVPALPPRRGQDELADQLRAEVEAAALEDVQNRAHRPFAETDALVLVTDRADVEQLDRLALGVGQLREDVALVGPENLAVKREERCGGDLFTYAAWTAQRKGSNSLGSLLRCSVQTSCCAVRGSSDCLLRNQGERLVK